MFAKPNPNRRGDRVMPELKPVKGYKPQVRRYPKDVKGDSLFQGDKSIDEIKGGLSVPVDEIVIAEEEE